VETNQKTFGRRLIVPVPMVNNGILNNDEVSRPPIYLRLSDTSRKLTCRFNMYRIYAPMVKLDIIVVFETEVLGSNPSRGTILSE
jgi:hypothetical protein